MQALHDVRQKAASTVQLTAPDTTTVQTAAPPAGAVACLVSVSTTTGRLSFNGVTPAATNGHIVQIAQNPLYLPFAVTIKAVSTAAANSVIDITWLY